MSQRPQQPATPTNSPASDAAAKAFIARWEAAGGSERANYQLFLTELAELLGVEKPQPASDDARDNAYVFERRVTFRNGDGTESTGFIDLYRRQCFVLEAKKVKATQGTGGFDDALMRARGQAENYARALPLEEGRPPFVVVVDVGNVIELYAEFSRSGATYTPFPDARSHRIALTALAKPETQELLRKLWLDPLALDPSRASAAVTQEIARHLADLAKSLETQGHPPEVVASFLTRCLFSMFAEDIELLPTDSFKRLLDDCVLHPEEFAPLAADLWADMDKGGFSAVLRKKLHHFNGKLFKDSSALSLNRDQLGLLALAAKQDWKAVEPAIFGTLLERALDPVERHALGAHYTPRSYVERLVLPTVVEPLRKDWATVQAAALTLQREGTPAKAKEVLRKFHRHLCEVRVLDPACGSGNFLYVTLEHLKRLEGEVLVRLAEFGDKQSLLELGGVTIDPHQLMGIEKNPRAAAIAELVLWIGYLQWHQRTHGRVGPPEPVLKDFKNIECRDAVLTWDRVEPVIDDSGMPVTHWDGRTMKAHPASGNPVPDESARAPECQYVRPGKATWPRADFVVGNPPFIGNKRMRDALGNGYVEALREAWSEVPESADFVMYWWHHAAELARSKAVKRFGLITTNSVRQEFNRRVIEHHLSATPPLGLRFAVPDHPWVDSADGAAVRISMTTGSFDTASPGTLMLVAQERPVEKGDGELEVTTAVVKGLIHADLTTGTNVTKAAALRANSVVSNRGVIPHGDGMMVSPEFAKTLGLGTEPGLESRIRLYRNGKDLTDKPRNKFAIDLFGLSEDDALARFPKLFHHLHETVKPKRDVNPRKVRRENWWLFGENQPRMRASIAGLKRFVATPQTSKHRFFVFLDATVLPDDKLIAIGLDDAFHMGVLSSTAHQVWALATGATLEDRPVYNKTTCFEAFPFPETNADQRERIRAIAERLSTLRSSVVDGSDAVTITGIYNVMEKLREGTSLNEKEQVINREGTVGALRTLHEQLDEAVLNAYGWTDLVPLQKAVNGQLLVVSNGQPGRPAAIEAFKNAILEKLVELNLQRADEEERGRVRWLRPEFQSKEEPQTELAGTEAAEGKRALKTGATKKRREKWPTEPAEQARAVALAFAAAARPLSKDQLAESFTSRGRWRERLDMIVEMLVALGTIRELPNGSFSPTR